MHNMLGHLTLKVTLVFLCDSLRVLHIRPPYHSCDWCPWVTAWEYCMSGHLTLKVTLMSLCDSLIEHYIRPSYLHRDFGVLVWQLETIVWQATLSWLLLESIAYQATLPWLWLWCLCVKAWEHYWRLWDLLREKVLRQEAFAGPCPWNRSVWQDGRWTRVCGFPEIK